jgi:hypothetical protein
MKFYFDGQLIDTDSSVTSLFNAASGEFALGCVHSGGILEEFDGRIQELVMINGTAATDDQMRQIYSRRFTNWGTQGQLAGGHELADDSFPYDSLVDRVSYFPLNAASATDSSGNGHTLTAENGAVGGDAVGIFGVSNTAADMDSASSHTFYSTDTFFKPGLNGSFSMGAWFAPTDVLPSSFMRTMSLNNGNSDWVTMNLWDSGFVPRPKLSWNISDTDAINKNCVYEEVPIEDGQWFHMGMVVTAGKLTGYFNGKAFCSFEHNGMQDQGTPVFRVSGRAGVGTMTQPFNGRIDEVFYVNEALTSQDMLKLASTKIVHNTNLAIGDQDWFVKAGREDGHNAMPLPFPGIVDMHDTDVSYWDFSDHPAGTELNIELKER